MLQTLITSIKSICEGITGIKQVYEFPLQSNPTQYPAIIFFQDNVENSFETTSENFNIYTFKLYIVVNVAGTTVENVYKSVMPKIFDEVKAEFDENWNIGTVGGHRVWARLSANQFAMSVEEKSKTATVDCTLQVKTLTTN